MRPFLRTDHFNNIYVEHDVFLRKHFMIMCFDYFPTSTSQCSLLPETKPKYRLVKWRVKEEAVVVRAELEISSPSVRELKRGEIVEQIEPVTHQSIEWNSEDGRSGPRTGGRGDSAQYLPYSAQRQQIRDIVLEPVTHQSIEWASEDGRILDAPRQKILVFPFKMISTGPQVLLVVESTHQNTTGCGLMSNLNYAISSSLPSLLNKNTIPPGELQRGTITRMRITHPSANNYPEGIGWVGFFQQLI